MRDASVVKARLREAYCSPQWNPFPWDCVTSRAPASGSVRNSLTVLANRSNHAAWLEGMTEKADAMLQAGAYVHWYEKHGLSAGDIKQALEGCHGITDAYERIAA